ncbi:hypothetical protein DB313_04970 (plasmid) [Borrelia turcica IST7]|uniref:Complement regulator-acquiring protein n=1 Tax=Borrelia turcica IST7 TaxID=1104446 RepID=A0A386PPE6_9SPIR|nr:hypothetical protein [Borrelia turcica]AYE36853.1 hypothetical protein DB313_04970 [Borrelia turcica IST7]
MKRISIIMLVLFALLTIVNGAYAQTVSVARGKASKVATKSPEEIEADMEAKEKAYSELEKNLNELKEELTESKNELTDSFTTLDTKIKELPKNMQLGKGDSDSLRLDKIYAGLDYDADDIKRVEEILDKLYVSGSDRDAAYKLLNLLYGIGNSTYQIVNELLGEANLAKLKDNSNIIDIKDMLNEFITLREEVLERVAEQIKVAATQKNSKQRMLAELSKMTRSNAVIYNRVYGKSNSLLDIQKEFEKLVK